MSISEHEIDSIVSSSCSLSNEEQKEALLDGNRSANSSFKRAFSGQIQRNRMAIHSFHFPTTTNEGRSRGNIRTGMTRGFTTPRDRTYSLESETQTHKISVVESHIISNKNARSRLIESEETEDTKLKCIAKDLMGMGFREKLVVGIIDHMQITNIEEAIDYMLKPPTGWIHKYIPEDTGDMESMGTCLICEEPPSEHVEFREGGYGYSGSHGYSGSIRSIRSITPNPNPNPNPNLRSFISNSGSFTDNGEDMFNKFFLTDFKPTPTGGENIKHRDSYIIFQERTQRMSERVVEDERKQKFEEDEVACGICYETLSWNMKYSLECRHHFCNKCVIDYLEYHICNGNVLELSCPEHGCRIPFNLPDLKSLLTPEIFYKYLKFRENIAVNLKRNIRWCPRADCGRYVEKVGGKNHLVCICGEDFCFKCGGSWHPKISCKKSIAKKYGRYAVEKNVRRCPGCSIPVDKDTGCNHMTCYYCKHEWCWICGLAYWHGHYDNPFFGCTGGLLEYDDPDQKLVSFTKMIIVTLVLILTWPFICFLGSFCVFLICKEVRGGKFFTATMYSLIFILWLLTLLLAVPLMLLPSWVYQIYKLLFFISIRRRIR